MTIEWEELPAVTDMETALDAGTPVIHPEIGDNLAFRRTVDAGEVEMGTREWTRAKFARAYL